MLAVDALAVIRRARALRLRSRGLRFMANRHREEMRVLRERIWATTELNRMERVGQLEQLAILRCSVLRLRNWRRDR